MNSLSNIVSNITIHIQKQYSANQRCEELILFGKFGFLYSLDGGNTERKVLAQCVF